MDLVRWQAAQSSLESATKILATLPESSVYTRTAVKQIRVRWLMHSGQIPAALVLLQNAIDELTAISGDKTLEVLQLQALMVQLLRTSEPANLARAQQLANAIRDTLDALAIHPAWAVYLAVAASP